MPAFLRKLFERYAKRMLTHPVRPSILEEGIMTIPQNKRVKRWAEDVYQDLKAAGVTDDMIKTEKDIKTLHSQVAELNNQNIAKGFERILDESKPKKLADVLDLTGKKIPPGSQIMGGKEVKIDIVADTIATIKSKKPIDAMKEANSVIGRKGKYKKLTPEESKKILKDTEDHIFQRDVPIDPEDLAGGGVAGGGITRLGFYQGGHHAEGMPDTPGGGHRGGEEGQRTVHHPGLNTPYTPVTVPRGIDKPVARPDQKNILQTAGENVIKHTGAKKVGSLLGIGTKTIPQLLALRGIYNMFKYKTQNPTFEEEDVIYGIPEFKAHGGRTGTGLNYLLGEDDQNVRVPINQGGRIGLKKGTKFDPTKRTFLKGIAALATLPVVGKYFKWAKPLAKSSKVLTSVPIKDISGMPTWFKPLVNKVIKEGEDVTKKFSTMDREIVHAAELPGSKTKVLVSQDITTGNVAVDIGYGKHGFKEGHLGQPVRLEYKAAEDIMSGPDMDDMHKVGVRDPHLKVKRRDEMTFDQKKHPDKTPEEFWVEEAEFTGGRPENVKFEDVSYEKFGEHGSNFDEVEKFATGKVKKKSGKASIKAQREHWVDEGDMASGGLAGMLGE